MDPRAPFLTLSSTEVDSAPPSSETEQTAESAKHSPCRQDDSLSVGSAKFVSTDDAKKLVAATSKNIDWLDRISAAILNSTKQRSTAKADLFKITNEYGDEITSEYEKMCEAFVARDFPGLAKTLTKRLATTMALRRRRILYYRARGESIRLSEQEQSVQPIRDALGNLSWPASDLDAASNPSPKVASEHTTTQPQTSVISATTFNSSAFRRQFAPSHVPSAKTWAVKSDYELSFPPAPRVPNGEGSFVCPYCCIVRPLAEAMVKERWQ